MKRKGKELENYANAASREGLTYGKKQQQEYIDCTRIGPVPSGYRSAGSKTRKKEERD